MNLLFVPPPSILSLSLSLYVYTYLFIYFFFVVIFVVGLVARDNIQFESWKYIPEVHDHPSKMDRKELIREECASNYMTRWFCGMSSICKTASEEALEKAIDNIRRDYVFVGVSEQMHLSMQVLKATLPSFFGSANRQGRPKSYRKRRHLRWLGT